jgi:hypothetical protein
VPLFGTLSGTAPEIAKKAMEDFYNENTGKIKSNYQTQTHVVILAAVMLSLTEVGTNQSVHALSSQIVQKLRDHLRDRSNYPSIREFFAFVLMPLLTKTSGKEFKERVMEVFKDKVLELLPPVYRPVLDRSLKSEIEAQFSERKVLMFFPQFKYDSALNSGKSLYTYVVPQFKRAPLY